MKKIQDVLEKSPFGLTSVEIAKISGVNWKTAERALDRLVSEKKAKRTRAGRSYFYGIIKIIVIISFISAAYAQNMSSTNFRLYPVMASAGGDSQGTTFQLAGKLGQPVSGISNSPSFELCAGFVCNFLEAIINAKVTFLLEFSISGSVNDTAYVDNETALNQYTPAQISNYYACLHDTALSSSPVFGIVFAGSSLNYVNLSSNTTANNSFSLRLSQDVPGNEFIIPVTHTNCTVINTKLPEIAQTGTVLNPFVALNEAINAVELILGYQNIDISGSFDRSGAFTLVVEKNSTNEEQIIVKPA